jgi:cytochrome c peroxidase
MRTFLTTILFATTANLALASDLPNPILPSDFPALDTETVALGRQLFFDPVLSGNDNIACATCHHPALGTGDAMSLSIGEGGLGLGRLREVVNAMRQRHGFHAMLQRFSILALANLR